jgi:AAA+ superfamily predicted ATPase
VDALATSRDSGNMHEATRRILSVILQNIEGFKQGNKNVLICATNRKAVSSMMKHLVDLMICSIKLSNHQDSTQ